MFLISHELSKVHLTSFIPLRLTLEVTDPFTLKRLKSHAIKIIFSRSLVIISKSSKLQLMNTASLHTHSLN